MSVEKLLELAEGIPFEELQYLDEETSYITGGYFERMRDPDPDVISRIKRKVVYSVTWEDSKYGDVIAIYYLDEQPAILVTFAGKWLSPLAAYVIKPDVHKALVGVIAEHHVQTMTNLEMLSDDYVKSIGINSKRYFKGDPLDAEHFPVNINGYHQDYIR